MPGLSKVRAALSRLRHRNRRHQTPSVVVQCLQSTPRRASATATSLPPDRSNADTLRSIQSATGLDGETDVQSSGEKPKPAAIPDPIESSDAGVPVDGGEHLTTPLASGNVQDIPAAVVLQQVSQEATAAAQNTLEDAMPPATPNGALDDDEESAVAPVSDDVAGIASDDAEQSEPIDRGKYWGLIESISYKSLAALANSLVRPKSGEFEPDYQVIGQQSGAFNCAYFLESPYGEKLVVRVPAAGSLECWNEDDARLLRNGALGMEYLRKKTDLPVPRLIHYDTTLNNEISAPYTLMTFIKGHTLTKVWDQSEDDSITREARRQNVLRSIAKIMPRFQSTTFKQHGVLSFQGRDEDEPVIANATRLTVANIFTIKREFTRLPITNSVREFVQNGKEDRFQDFQYPRDSKDPIVRGFYILWEMMLDAFLEVASLEGDNPEDFVLMQSDFNPQNIMADVRGNITGLIDWDCIETVPRQKGWSVVPHWLAADWNVDYHWPMEGFLKSVAPDAFEKYRQDYAKYLREACAGKAGDEKYTPKSHIYGALLSSHETFAKVTNFVCNVLADILPRNAEKLEIFVGDIGARGFQEGQKEWMQGRLAQYFRPGGSGR